MPQTYPCMLWTCSDRLPCTSLSRSLGVSRSTHILGIVAWSPLQITRWDEYSKPDARWAPPESGAPMPMRRRFHWCATFRAFWYFFHGYPPCRGSTTIIRFGFRSSSTMFGKKCARNAAIDLNVCSAMVIHFPRAAPWGGTPCQ